MLHNAYTDEKHIDWYHRKASLSWTEFPTNLREASFEVDWVESPWDGGMRDAEDLADDVVVHAFEDFDLVVLRIHRQDLRRGQLGQNQIIWSRLQSLTIRQHNLNGEDAQRVKTVWNRRIQFPSAPEWVKERANEWTRADCGAREAQASSAERSEWVRGASKWA